jgi:glycosyltransferase involved in cell wall biosynthesis
MKSSGFQKESKKLDYTKYETNNVLMVCSTFPPQSYVGGLRPAMFSKYLPVFGWEPIVFARELHPKDILLQPTMEIRGLPQNEKRIAVFFGTKEEEKAGHGRKFYTLIKHFIFPDFAHPAGFVDKMLDATKQSISENKISAVWATSPPLGCLTVAAKIAKSRNVPWIADFRDIQEQDLAIGFRLKLLHYRLFIRRSYIIRSASAIVTVSEYHARTLNKKSGKKINIIPNGFDPEMFKGQQLPRFKKFSIIYMGRILSQWLRNPAPLFDALDLLINSGNLDKKDIEVLFYGSETALLENVLRSHKCRNIVRAVSRVPYKEVPNILKNSCILLVLTNKGRKGILTTKVFEYIGAQRPILCVPGDGGELDALIRDSRSGVSCSTAESAATVLKQWYEEWKKTGTVVCKSKRKEILKYSREKQTERLANLLNIVCSEFKK